jgi:alpha-beta hydrolase superfamily lysophospholipase
MRHREFELTGGESFLGSALAAVEWAPEGEIVGVVCLVHGLGEHCGRYAYVADVLAASGFATLAVDLPGHGRSPGKRGHLTIPQALMAVDLLLDEAASRHQRRPRFLYGHSLGGCIALNYALRRERPIAGVVATSPLLRPAFSPPGWKLAAAAVCAYVWPTLSLSNGLNAADISRDQAVSAGYRKDALVHDRVSAALGHGMLAAGRWALAHANELREPLLLVHGTADAITSVEASRQFAALAGSGCELRLWPGLRHETHNEPERDLVLGEIASWLQARSGDSPLARSGG